MHAQPVQQASIVMLLEQQFQAHVCHAVQGPTQSSLERQFVIYVQLAHLVLLLPSLLQCAPLVLQAPTLLVQQPVAPYVFLAITVQP